MGREGEREREGREGREGGGREEGGREREGWREGGSERGRGRENESERRGGGGERDRARHRERKREPRTVARSAGWSFSSRLRKHRPMLSTRISSTSRPRYPPCRSHVALTHAAASAPADLFAAGAVRSTCGTTCGAKSQGPRRLGCALPSRRVPSRPGPDAVSPSSGLSPPPDEGKHACRNTFTQ